MNEILLFNVAFGLIISFFFLKCYNLMLRVVVLLEEDVKSEDTVSKIPPPPPLQRY
tara:strand:+ start:372 stop:539 length:168 start_codon:yes stop_codon:yes gene_type:complete